MTKFKVGQKWRTRGDDIRTIEAVYANGVLLDDGTHRYLDGSYYDAETDDGDLAALIQDVPEDDLHPCLERVEKLVVKEGVYGRFRVSRSARGVLCVWAQNSGVLLSKKDFAEAAALFTALARATEGAE